ncbi:hypothetical protein QWM81_12780 [Streptomyces ficellus]|uniref:DUF6895 domain-containing protein n=1 Tax=Streptomyces ficellus TaxID=1977088 RepID=A0ABT7Z757_9ACTN|nr:hypothetical protein [Streptomyces ficellus]MDN3294911.1 hypothetical protein [Streptomyces ficellus]
MSTPVARIAHDVSSRALAWLHANRHHGRLSCLPSTDFETDETYKALGETALAASLVLRSGVAGATELHLARALLDFSWQQLGSGTLLYERLLHHPLKTDPLETYAHFVRGGYSHPQLARLLAHTVTLPSTHAAELLPNRRLAVANAIRVCRLDHGDGAPDWESLTRATWLGTTPDPWHIDWVTGYYATHTIYHLTDWGRLPAFLPPDLADYASTWLPVWIDIWAETSQWDLMAELMMAGDCLPVPRTDPNDWQLVANLQHQDGMMPCDNQPISDDPVERFIDHQHTTIVVVIAGTLALARALDRPPPH